MQDYPPTPSLSSASRDCSCLSQEYFFPKEDEERMRRQKAWTRTVDPRPPRHSRTGSSHDLRGGTLSDSEAMDASTIDQDVSGAEAITAGLPPSSLVQSGSGMILPAMRPFDERDKCCTLFKPYPICWRAMPCLGWLARGQQQDFQLYLRMLQCCLRTVQGGLC